MQMHAITKHYGIEEAIKLAILAGVDVMTFSNNISGSEERTVDRVHGIIRKLVLNGAISEKRIDESYQRIMALKKSFSFDKGYYQRLALSQEQLLLKNLKVSEEAAKKAEQDIKNVKKTESNVETQDKSNKKKRSKKKE